MFENRIKSLNINKINKEAHTIIYWMQRSIRTKYNHALEYAVEMANELKKDLLVIFSIEKNFSDANERSFSFLVESLKDVEKNLKKRGIRFIVVDSISLVDKIIEYSKDTACIITDRAYLKYLVKAREELAEKAEIRVIQVESDVVVPVEITSDKEEYSAKTIRGNINKVLDFYLNKKFEEFKYDGKYLSEIES